MDTEEIPSEILLKWTNAYSTPSCNRDVPGHRTQQLSPQSGIKGWWSSAKAQILTDPPPFYLVGTSERGNRAAKGLDHGLRISIKLQPKGLAQVVHLRFQRMPKFRVMEVFIC